jgi:hypothetical protein
MREGAVLLKENLCPGDALGGTRSVEGFDFFFREPAEQIAIPEGQPRSFLLGLDGLVSRRLQRTLAALWPSVL